MTRPERPSSLAASPDLNSLRLELIDRAKGNGASWAVIGAALGMSGREAKRHAHRLRDQARRAAMAEAAPPAATGTGAHWAS